MKFINKHIIMHKIIVVNATALRTSGALTILYQFLEAIPNHSVQYLVFLDSCVYLQKKPSNVTIVNINKRSLPKRFLWDAIGLKQWLNKHKILPNVALSLQNTNFRLNTKCSNYIYFHQPVSLFPYKWNFLKSSERFLWFYKHIYPFFVKIFINPRTEIFVQLECIKDSFSRRYKFPSNKIHVVSPQIKIPQYEEGLSCEDLKIDKNTFNLFFPAGLNPYKNHELLFKAFSFIDNLLSIKITFYMSSVSPDFNPPYKYNNIEILALGRVPYNTIAYLYNNTDMLLFPSYIETFGLPLVEAASVGLPVLVSDLSYAREVLCGYEGVTYIDYKDEKAWGDAILKYSICPKTKFTPFQLTQKATWNHLFEIIERKL
jgi:glycosyltransferase involved in cell wall biosynthesis